MTLVAHIPVVTEIQNYDTSDFSNVTGVYGDIDWANKLLYCIGSSDSAIKSVNLSTFNTHDAATAMTAFTNGVILGEDGFLYGVHLATNQAILHKVNVAALGVDVSTFGVGASSFTTDATHWAYPYDFDTIVSHGVHYLVSTSFDHVQTSNEMTVLNLDTMAWAGYNFSADEPSGVVTRGADHGGNGCAYVFSCAPGGPVLGMYRIEISALGVVTNTKVANIAAASIRNSWSIISETQGCLLDATDGNLIVHLNNGVDARIIKVNALTGAVMWSLPVLGSLGAIYRINSSRVQYGLYGYVDTQATSGFTHNIHFIRTLTGEDTIIPLDGVNASNQFWDDFEGNWVGLTNYADFGTPDPHGTTPSIFNTWATLGGFPKPSAPAPSAQVFLQAQVFG